MEIMDIHWKDGALDDFKQIALWYHNDYSNQVAEKFINNVLHCIDLLSVNPLMGHTEVFEDNRLTGYRSLVIHPNYKIVYSPDMTNNIIHIMAIWDCRQDISKLTQSIKR